MVSWPVGLGAAGSEGVSAKVKETPGSIGYFELFYARRNQLPFAEIKNREGYYVKASLDSVTDALSTATIPDDFRFSMVNAPGSKPYPIAARHGCSSTRSRGIPRQARNSSNFSNGRRLKVRRWPPTSVSRRCPTAYANGCSI